MAEEKETKKKLSVDADLCIGCGSCEGIAPEYFVLKDGVSVVTAEYDEADADLIDEAIDSCPVQAIILKEEKAVASNLKEKAA